MRREKWFSFIAALILQGLLYHGLSCLFLNFMYTEQLSRYIRMFLLCVPLFLFTAVRMKCKNFSLFLILHFLIGIAVCVAAPSDIRAVLGFCILFMAVLSVHERTAPEYGRESCPPVASVIVFLLVYIMAWQQKLPLLMDLCYFETMAFLVLFVICKSLDHMVEFLAMNEKSENLPASQIAGLNKLLLAFFILLLIMGMLLFRFLPLDGVLSGIGRAARVLVRKVIEFFLNLLNGGDEAVSEPVSEMGGPLELDAGGQSLLVQILDRVLRTVMIVGAWAVVILLAAKLMYELYRRFYANRHPDADESEFILRESLLKERAEGLGKGRERLFGGTPNQRIRRYYRNYVRKKAGKKLSVPQSLTPEEVERYLEGSAEGEGLKTAEACRRLDLYEKARYSQYQCGRGEQEEMKRCCRSDA